MAAIDSASLDWRTSSYSGPSGNCVEVAGLSGGGRAARDSKDRDAGPVLRFTAREWAAFTASLRTGEFG